MSDGVLEQRGVSACVSVSEYVCVWGEGAETVGMDESLAWSCCTCRWRGR